MQTCIQNYVPVTKDLDNVVLSVRLRGADAVRFWRVMDDAKTRNPYIDKSDVIRELLGLDPPSVLSITDIKHFQGQEKPQQKHRLTHPKSMGEMTDERKPKRETG